VIAVWIQGLAMTWSHLILAVVAEAAAAVEVVATVETVEAASRAVWLVDPCPFVVRKRCGSF
jgi:hypothetical protein